MICRKHPEQYPGVPCAKCIAEAWSDYIVDEPKEAEVSLREFWIRPLDIPPKDGWKITGALVCGENPQDGEVLFREVTAPHSSNLEMPAKSQLKENVPQLKATSAATFPPGEIKWVADAPKGATVPVMPPLDEQDVWRSLGYDDEREPAVRAILDGARYAYKVGFNRCLEALAKGEA